MADILTPPNARKTEEFEQTQVELVRNSLGIGDFPYQPDKTYILFDADSGDNDLHIDTGGSSTYSILKGNGGLSGGIATEYTDTGGTKVINYVNAGRYIITIEGTFNGINTNGESSGDKDKYIGIIAGSNYPVAITDDAFDNCDKLEFVKLLNATSIGASSFSSCGVLNNVYLPFVTTIGGSSFSGCVKLIDIYIPVVNIIGDGSFSGCVITDINLPFVTTIPASAFNNCGSLISVNFPLVTNIGSSFQNCTSLKNIDFPLATTIQILAFQNCTSLKTVNLPSVTSVQDFAFDGCVSLVYFKIKYTAGLSIGVTSTFQNVNLSDLYVIGAANLTEAQSVETKLTTAGMTQLNGYRLLY